jgi:hypothetical protein
MKMSHVWKSSSRKKKTKPTYKIRWEVLGLSRPDQMESALSMETIRSEVSLMATQGLTERTPSAASPGEAKRHKSNVTGSQPRRRAAKQ